MELPPAAGRSWRSGSSPAATAASSPCSTARTNCSASPARSRSPTSRRRHAAVVEGPYDLSLVEGSVTTADDAARIQEVRRGLPAAGDDRRVRHRRRHPGTAQLRRRRGVPLRSSTPSPSTSRRWRPPPRSRPTSRWTSSCAAARSTRRSCSRCSPRSCSAAGPGSPTRASAWSASGAATSASRSRTAPRAWVRSPTPGAARSARRTTAAATAASGPTETPEHRRR